LTNADWGRTKQSARLQTRIYAKEQRCPQLREVRFIVGNDIFTLHKPFLKIIYHDSPNTASENKEQMFMSNRQRKKKIHCRMMREKHAAQ
jgi:hypothetical protein